MIYQIADWAATFIECLILLLSVIQITGKKWGNHNFYIPVYAVALVNTLLVAFINSIKTFSFITPLISIAYLLCVSWFFTKGTLILRAASCIMTLFVILAIGYIWMILACLLHGGDFENTFLIFMTPCVFFIWLWIKQVISSSILLSESTFIDCLHLRIDGLFLFSSAVPLSTELPNI